MAYPVLSHFGPANIGAGDRLRTRDLSLTRRLLCHLSYTGKSGGQGRHRTGDLSLTRRLLYLLSYSAKLAGEPGVEPGRAGFGVPPVVRATSPANWLTRRDLNPQRPG